MTWQEIKSKYELGSIYNLEVENILTEEETEFDLIIPFPFKILDNYDETLTNLGINNNTMLTVREK